MADRSDADIAKYIDRGALSGRWIQGDDGKVSFNRKASVEERENTGQSYSTLPAYFWGVILQYNTV